MSADVMIVEINDLFYLKFLTLKYFIAIKQNASFGELRSSGPLTFLI